MYIAQVNAMYSGSSQAPQKRRDGSGQVEAAQILLSLQRLTRRRSMSLSSAFSNLLDKSHLSQEFVGDDGVVSESFAVLDIDLAKKALDNAADKHSMTIDKFIEEYGENFLVKLPNSSFSS